MSRNLYITGFTQNSALGQALFIKQRFGTGTIYQIALEKTLFKTPER